MGKNECGEEVQACEHQLEVLYMVGETRRKEYEIRTQQRLKAELGKCLDNRFSK